MKQNTITAKFSKFIPEVLEDGILYVSLEFGTAVHLCACGCKEITVTPLNDKVWNLTMNGEKATLNPSIGNFQIPCKSHYFIRDGQIINA